MELSKLLMRNNNDRYVAKYDGIEVLTYINNLFHSLKSFLDIYTLLLCRLIDPKQTTSFKRKAVDGESLSGGAFIRWLRQSAPKSFDKATNLADFVLEESKEWITEAVNHRDAITHYTNIDDINCLSVSLIRISQPSEPMFEKKQVEKPTMPDGMKVREYSLYIGERLRNYVITTISMFSNVKHDLLHYPDFDIEEPVWP